MCVITPTAQQQQASRMMQPKTTMTMRRKVTFSCTVEVTEILHYKEYTREEKKSCWYTLRDIARIKERNVHIAKLFRENKKEEQVSLLLNDDDEEECSRGLEHRVVPGGGRKNVRDAARAMVLNEQRNQQKMQESVRNPTMIAERYRTISRSCEIKAYRTGLMDQIQAAMPPTTVSNNDVILPIIVTLQECAIVPKSDVNKTTQTTTGGGWRSFMPRIISSSHNQDMINNNGIIISNINNNGPTSATNEKQLVQRNACAA